MYSAGKRSCSLDVLTLQMTLNNSNNVRGCQLTFDLQLREHPGF